MVSSWIHEHLPGRDEVVVLECEVDRWTSVRGFGAGGLSLREQERAKTFEFRAARTSFIVGRTLLRELLGAAAGVHPCSFRLDPDAHGKLHFEPESRWQFSVSHTERWVVIALAERRDLGVDVECQDLAFMSRDFPTEALAPTELDRHWHLPAELRAEHFLETWVMKESYVKGLGVGMAKEFSSFDVRKVPDWEFFLFHPDADHLGCLASRGKPTEIRRLSWSP